MNDMDRLELQAECAEVIVHLVHLLGRLRECGAKAISVRDVEVAKMLVAATRGRLEGE